MGGVIAWSRDSRTRVPVAGPPPLDVDRSELPTFAPSSIAHEVEEQPAGRQGGEAHSDSQRHSTCAQMAAAHLDRESRVPLTAEGWHATAASQVTV